jgi:hypothetical protein
MKENQPVNAEQQYVRADSPNYVLKQVKRFMIYEFCFVAGGVGVLFLAILTADKPFGPQITMLVAYTGFVFYFVFCDSRAWKGYSLRLAAVRRKLPTLLAIHAAFLLFVFVAATVVISVYHRVGKGSRDTFALLMCALAMGIIMTQTYISRNILNRSVDAG